VKRTALHQRNFTHEVQGNMLYLGDRLQIPCWILLSTLQNELQKRE